MNRFFMILFLSSFCGSISFVITWIFKKLLFSTDYLIFFYRIMKIIAIIFVGPVILPILLIFNSYIFYKKTNLTLDDFTYVEQYSGLKEMKNLNNIDFLAILTIIYLITVIIIFVLSSINRYSLKKSIAKYSYECTDERRDILQNIRNELGISKHIALYISNAIDTPCLIGIITTQVLIPNINLDIESWQLLLKHELIHYKNHDLIFRKILEIIRIIHWINPIMYYWINKFNELGELVCDKITVREESQSKRKLYAKLLLKFAKNIQEKSGVAFFSSNYEYHILKGRIENIMETKCKEKTFAKILITIGITLSCSIISYASTLKVLNIQNDFVSNVEEGQSTLENKNSEFNEYTTYTFPLTSFINAGNLDTKGSNSIDFTLDATGELRFSPVSLNQGSSIRISVSSDSSSDTFRAGIIDENGKRRYVISDNGMVAKKFTIDTAGDYRVYFQGKNTNGSDIHLTGTINVDY